MTVFGVVPRAHVPAPVHYSSALARMSRPGLGCIGRRPAILCTLAAFANRDRRRRPGGAAPLIRCAEGFCGRDCPGGQEDSWPTSRPPLSKKYLAGALAVERLTDTGQRTSSADHAIETYLKPARDAHRAHHAQRIRLDDGTTLPYDGSCSQTGSRPRALSAPGAHCRECISLRTLKDARQSAVSLRTRDASSSSAAVYIGLEVAAICRELGLDTTVLEMADRTMNRVTLPPRCPRRAGGATHAMRSTSRATSGRAIAG